MNPSGWHTGGPTLDVSKPIWPLLAISVAILGGGWLIEVVGGLL
jgi:hypothetical protein